MATNLDNVFPARAGMNRHNELAMEPRQCVPRAGGDEPAIRLSIGANSGCSPRGRG